jgi:NAD-dependent protein deacetylase/lipoamidase
MSEPSRPSIVVLTGAGISKESGLDTLRDADGIWAKVRLEEVATPEGFARRPRQVHAFYNARRQELRNPNIQPNAAHRALAALEAAWPGEFLLVAQNIDNLHERAGGLRPHVVWFGEMPFEMERIAAALARATVLVSIGTSGSVNPAAGFVAEARKAAGARTVELNLEPSVGAQLFAERRYGAASEVVPRFVDELLASL